MKNDNLNGFEIVGTLNTIADEIYTRKRTSQKINRSIDCYGTSDNYGVFENIDLDTLRKMQFENSLWLSKLIELQYQTSPYKNVKPTVLEAFQPGAIVFDSWGYDQTNIDFYCIVKRTTEFLTLLPMTIIRSAEIGFMSYDNMPGKIDFTAMPIKKKIKNFEGKERGFSMRDYVGGGWVTLFNGKAKNSTHYA